MENGRFTESEIAYLMELDAVDAVTDDGTVILWNADFREEFLRRHAAGEAPSDIFRDAGVGPEVIGRKRLERCSERWRAYERDHGIARPVHHPPRRQHGKGPRLPGARTYTERQVIAMRARHERECEVLRERIEYQAELKERARAEADMRLERHKRASKAKLERTVASQAARIEALEAQVRALKANGMLARRTQRAPQTTGKSERFELISQLRDEDPTFNVSAACEALEVSRRGYYKWLAAAPARAEREAADLAARAQVEEAFSSHGFRKGSRQVRDSLLRDQGIVMNRKKVQRIMRKYGIRPTPRRKNPYHPIGTDGLPRVAPNLLGRDFHQGVARKVLLTDITFLRCTEGFCYLSAIVDGETGEVLGHVVSPSLEERFVLDTFEQLKGMELAPGALAHSDQGAHYTARAYRAKLAELGLVQSMSRRACCWDNASMESWFGRMKEQMGPTGHLTYAEVCARVDDYVEYYNRHRGQERLGWKTPEEYAASLAA